jgi:transposase
VDANRGRKPAVDLREVLNAIRYMARSAGGWRMLPVHFGPWQTVYWWFRRFVRRLLFRTIHNVALMLDREAAGREASPTGGVLDSQTAKAPFADGRTRPPRMMPADPTNSQATSCPPRAACPPTIQPGEKSGRIHPARAAGAERLGWAGITASDRR